MKFMKLETFDPLTSPDSGYVDGNFFYKVQTLLDAVKTQECKKFKYDLKSAVYPVYTKEMTAKDLAEHVKRINDADLDFPVILTPNGWIADGMHRMSKAFLQGRTWIWAVRLDKMPQPDEDNYKNN